MTITSTLISPQEFLLNPEYYSAFGAHLKIKDHPILLEEGSDRLRLINQSISRDYVGTCPGRSRAIGSEIKITGLVCHINYLDPDLFNFLPEKKAEWQFAGYRVAFLPKKTNPARLNRAKKDPNLGDCLKRTRKPPVMYAFIGHDTIASRICLVDALFAENLIDRSGHIIDWVIL